MSSLLWNPKEVKGLSLFNVIPQKLLDSKAKFCTFCLRQVHCPKLLLWFSQCLTFASFALTQNPWTGSQIWSHVWFHSEKSIFTARSCPSCRSDLVAGPFDQRPGGWNMRQSLPQPYFFSDTISLFHFWHSIFFPICDFYTDGNIQKTFLWHTGHEWSVPFPLILYWPQSWDLSRPSQPAVV